MKLKKLLSTAFVATLMAVGSAQAEEPKTTQMKPGHSVESHKMNAGHPAEGGASHKMNAGQAAKPLQMNGENAHGIPHGGQGHQHDAHKPLPNMPVRNADTHHQMEHGTPHNAAVHKNVSSWGQPWTKLNTADQVLYKKNLNDILVLQNGLFGNPHLTNNPGFDAVIYRGTFMRDILKTCDAFCQQTNQDRCAFVEGLKDSHGLSIPADRQAFLNCFQNGVAQQPASQGICFETCTGGVDGSPNACGDQKIRQGCKLLCCGMRTLMGNCLPLNNDNCDGF